MRNESGYVLVSVLLLVIILSILGGAYIFASNFEVRSSAQRSAGIQAYYFARSGVEYLLASQNFEGTHYLDSNLNPVEEHEKGDDWVEIEVQTLPEGRRRIRSTGMFRSAEKTTSIIIQIDTSSNPFTNALFAALGDGGEDAALELEGSSKIYGPFGTNATAPNSIKIGPSSSITHISDPLRSNKLFF